MKIVQVLDTFDEARNGGVISTRRFTAFLCEKGHEVTVVTTGHPGPGKVILKDFYPWIKKKTMQRMGFVFAKADEKVLEKTFREADVIHNQFPFLLGYHTIRVARRLNKPVVSTFHVQAEQVVYNAGLQSKFLVDQVYRLFVKYIYNRSDVVICPSSFAAEEIRKHGCLQPTVVISNGVPPEYQPSKVASAYPGKFVIVTVGRNAKEKRQEMIIRAVAASKYREQVQLVIIGNGPLREHLQEISKKFLPVPPDFLFLPPLEVIPYYSMADLYVHAAEAEVECMTALEAMSCGIPLLIAEAPASATKQFALNGKHLFRNAEELTARIDYWFEHRDALLLAKEEYKKYSLGFTIEESGKKLIEAYNLAIGLKKHQP